MTLEDFILYLIIFLVLIALPVLVARKSGKSPMEILLGERGSKGIFGRKNKDPENGGTAKEEKPKETNGTRKDLMNLVSRLVTYARRQHFRLIVPGTVSVGGSTAALTAILITRSRVGGFNAFGFGGTVTAGTGDADWKQVMNGEKTLIPSPDVKNRTQKKILEQAVADAGWPDVPVEIIGVFTSPSVRLSKGAYFRCYTMEELESRLQEERFTEDLGLDSKKLEDALEPMVVRVNRTNTGRQQRK